MDNSLDQQRLVEYQNRVSEWIGKQGVFFQLRHAGTIGASSVAKQLGSLLIRLFIILAILAGVGYFLLNRHFSSASYREKIGAHVADSLGAEVTEMGGLKLKRGLGTFTDLELKGGDDSFFYEAAFEDLTGSFEFLTGITKEWAPDELSIASAEIELKAGGDLEEMTRAFGSVIESLDQGDLNSIEIEKLTCSWGYSKLTHGSLKNTQFRAQREDGKWEIKLKGGTYSQNWLQDLTIGEAEIVCRKDGLEVISMSLSADGGEVNLSGAVTGPLSRPELGLKGEFTQLPLKRILNVQGIPMNEYIQGSISGDIEISGSTDHRVIIEGKVTLGGEDALIMRERWNILTVMSVLDMDRTYRRVDFKNGGFSFRTGGGGLTLSEIDLRAGTLARLKGGLETRLPTQQEAADVLGIKLTEGFGGAFSNDLTDTSSAQAMEDERMSLKKATGGGQQINDLGIDLDGSGGRAAKSRLSPKQMEEARLRHEMSVHRITGTLKLGVPAIAFAGNERLDKGYPVGQEGWRWVEMVLDSAFSKISEKAARQLRADALGVDVSDLDKAKRP